MNDWIVGAITLLLPLLSIGAMLLWRFPWKDTFVLHHANMQTHTYVRSEREQRLDDDLTRAAFYIRALSPEDQQEVLATLLGEIDRRLAKSEAGRAAAQKPHPEI